ncbi:TPA: hypothetical protein QDA97_004736 [Burkholderia vietnamiensis]|nr:hypothetical protein [Burkholderia vietnamiensis]
MTERPILFSGPMVRAILDGRKTQTRRVVKHQPPDDVAPIAVSHYHPTIIDRHGDQAPGDEIFGASSDDGEWGCKFPFGETGDRLWVRESITSVRHPSDGHIIHHVYAADGARIPRDPQLRSEFDDAMAFAHLARPSGIPSIHMPRWASRITLEITGVRAERLQEISQDDAEAEGIDFLRSVPDADETLDARGLFHCLWDGINAERGHGWEANPWVWVIEFRRIEP